MNRIFETIKYLQRVVTSKKRIYPSFIIIGSTRSGTTSLYEYLENHPNVLPSIKKEIGFFNYAYHKNPKWYKMYFPTRDEKQEVENIKKNPVISGESTPSYLIDSQVPKRIFSLLPKIKLIALLRNPLDRAISHYHLNVSLGIEKLSFEDAVKNESKRIASSLENLKKNNFKNENAVSYFLRMLTFKPENYFKFSYLNSGHYYDHLKNWYDIFPQDQILVIKSEDFFENPNETFQKVQRFLELPIVEFEKYWRAYEIKHPPMSENMRKYLKNHFEEHNSKLYKLLDKDFNWK